MMEGQSSRGRSWPIPGQVTNRAPGMASAVARPARIGCSGSTYPVMTRVGAWMRDSSARRSPDAKTAAAWHRNAARSGRCSDDRRRWSAAVVGGHFLQNLMLGMDRLKRYDADRDNGTRNVAAPATDLIGDESGLYAFTTSVWSRPLATLEESTTVWTPAGRTRRQGPFGCRRVGPVSRALDEALAATTAGPKCVERPAPCGEGVRGHRRPADEGPGKRDGEGSSATRPVHQLGAVLTVPGSSVGPMWMRRCDCGGSRPGVRSDAVASRKGEATAPFPITERPPSDWCCYPLKPTRVTGPGSPATRFTFPIGVHEPSADRIAWNRPPSAATAIWICPSIPPPSTPKAVPAATS